MKILLVLMGILCTINLCHGKESNMDDFARSLREFAGSMYSKMEELGTAENVVFSPSSVAHLLGMILNGAAGETENEIKLALMIKSSRKYSDENYHKLYRKTFNRLFNKTKVKGIETVLASRIFLQNDYPLLSNYTEDLKKYYFADAAPIDFTDKISAADRINSWISSETENQITEIIDPGSLGDNTRFVLTNALYFKASWAEKLEVRQELEPFLIKYSKPKNITFMGRKGHYKFRTGDRYKEISIPYEGEDNELIIVMPDNEKKMKEFYSRPLLIPYLRDLPNLKWRTIQVDFSMPKFDVEYETNAKEVLQGIGVRELFDVNKANLSKMSEEELHCSDIRHKAKVMMDEEGTVGAAAGFAGFAGRSAFAPKVFKVDKPFLFIIKRQNYILFVGKVTNPQYSEK